MLSLVLTITAAGLVTFFAYDFVTAYRQAVGTVGERVLATAKQAHVILWARFCAFVQSLTYLLVQAAGYLDAPGVADSIKTIMQPEYVLVFGVAVAVITEWARRYRASDL